MKAYLLTTGLAFGLLTAIHIWRYIEEGSGVADAFFVAVTLIAAGFCLWAFRLFRSLSRG